VHAWTRPLALALLATLAWAADASAAPPPANPITIENAKPGSTQWTPTQPTTAPPIEGYTSQASAVSGDTVDVHVSTSQPGPYHIEVYRLGWYHGAGGRLVECVPSCAAAEPGSPQPYPTPDPVTGLARADWPVTDQITIGPDWVSGYYEIKLVLDGAETWHTYPIPLIVRQAPTQAPSSILIEVPVNTWQAYNSWGGKSLYRFNSTGSQAAAKVSFDRPYTLGMDGQAPWNWETPFVHFLERNGYDVSYTTDVDVARNPGSLLGHKLVIVNGHDEYWTKSERDAFDGARDAGVNLAFFGSNIGFWQARYEDAERTLVEYRSASADPSPDPATKTTAFRALPNPRPECQLLGVEYQAAGGAHAYSPVAASLSNPWFSGTNLAADTQVTNILGYEPDSITPGCGTPTAAGTGVTTLFQGSAPTTSAAAVTYQAPSGARVFATGSLQWNWALDDPMGDSRIQRFTQNVLNDLSDRAPETSIDSIPTVGSSRDVSIPFSSSDPGASFECRLDGGWQPCTSPKTYDSLPDGTHWFTVQSISASGVPDATPAFHSLTVDSTPPMPFGLRDPVAGATVEARPQLSWRPSSDAGIGLRRYRIWIDASKVGTVRTSRTTYTPSFELAPGPHTWQVTAVDALGNTRESATRKFVTRRH
jgi:hypothetical protein